MDEILQDLQALAYERHILINAVKKAIRDSDEGYGVDISLLVNALYDVGEEI